MHKKILRILSFVLVVLLTLVVTTAPETAAVQSKEDRVLQQITDTYARALQACKVQSFRGYCGLFVNYHVYLLGITSSVQGGHGNQQFDNYRYQSYTTGGYKVEALSAKQYTMKAALNQLTQNGTVDVYNMIVGFQYTNTTAGQQYGHATFVHAIIDGMVYYSESFSCTVNGKYYPEGSPIVVTIDQFCKYYGSWTTFEGVIHFGLRNYQEECEFFHTYQYAIVQNETTMYSAACTPEVNKDSEEIRTVMPGERLTVIGMYRNTVGEYWYQVRDVQVGYVRADVTVTEELLYDDITVTGIKAPTEQRQGNIFNIQGDIRSTYNNICTVRAQVFTITQFGLQHWMTTTDSVTNNSYSLSYSVVSDRMAFRLLNVGSYRYEMAVVVSNNYIEDGVLQTEYTTLKLWRSDFRVVAKTGGTVSVKFDTCGGSAELNAAEIDQGATIGTMPEATRDGYIFLGWFTAAEGGEQVREDYVVTGKMTLYAQWAEAPDITGWCKEDGKHYYLVEGQRIVGFFQVDGITYYQGEDGFLATGWVNIDGGRYYFNTNGSMAQGWFDYDRVRYYFGADGTATIGWAEIDGQTYYFGEDCGMLTGKQTIEGVSYTFGEDGALIMQ